MLSARLCMLVNRMSTTSKLPVVTTAGIVVTSELNTLAPWSTAAPGNTFWHFLAHNVWLPILLGAIVILAVIITVLCFVKWRRSVRFDYTALKDEVTLPEKFDLDRRRQRDEIRDAALLNCSFYMRSHGLYSLIDHLPEMGSRISKHWFLVRDTRSKTEKLLTMMPRSTEMLLPFNNGTKKTLTDLFLLIQHPYIYPIFELDFTYDQELVVVIQPFNVTGSLKDLIYSSRSTDGWMQKYVYRGRGLPLHLVQLYGRQILEALLFLEEKGFPRFSHLHSGNIIVQNSICRLAAYETCLLNYSSKMSPLLNKKVKRHKDAIDSLCFGQLLYEMLEGAELDRAHPEPSHLVTVKHPTALEILSYIFDHSGGSYPSIKQISEHEFFREAVLEELPLYNPSPIHFTPTMKALLKSVRKGKKSRSSNKKGAAVEPSDADKYNIQSQAFAVEEEVTFKRSRANSKSSISSKGSKEGKKSKSKSKKGASAAVKSLQLETVIYSDHDAEEEARGGQETGLSGERSALLADIKKGVLLRRAAVSTDMNDPTV